MPLSMRSAHHTRKLTWHVEHAQRLLSQSQETTNTCIQHYKAILRSIFDNVPIIPQMRKDSDGKVISTLTSNYLCLQCPAIEKEETMAKHGTKKSHRFCRLS